MKSNTTVSPRLMDRFKKVITKKCSRVVDVAAQMALKEVFRDTPVEDGHAHQAWLSGGTEAIGASVNQAFAESGVSPSELSGDRLAIASGNGKKTVTKLRADVRIQNRLNFVRILEYGGVLRPIGPGGRKINPVMRPPMVGPLYGPRSSQGRGILVWTTPSGEVMRGFSRSYAPGRHVGKALNVVKNRLAPRGGK